MKTFKSVIVHPGIFHLDEVLCVAIIKVMGYSDLGSYGLGVERRVPTQEELNDAEVLVMDVGGQYEPELNNFDHHQDKDMRGACLYVWQKLAPASPVTNRIEEEFILPVAEGDSGHGKLGKCSISWAISQLNPGEDATDLERDDAFGRAVHIATSVLFGCLDNAIAWVAAKQWVLDAKTSNDGKVLVLEKYADWEEHVFQRDDQADLLYVAFPSIRGGWCMRQVPVEPRSFTGRKPLPASWAGKRGSEFQIMLGLKESGDATFCHPGCFICGAENSEDMQRIVLLAVEAK